VREELRESALGKALVAPVAPGDVLSAPACVATFDLATMAPADADFTARFRLQSSAGEVRGSRGAARISVPSARSEGGCSAAVSGHGLHAAAAGRRRHCTSA